MKIKVLPSKEIEHWKQKVRVKPFTFVSDAFKANGDYVSNLISFWASKSVAQPGSFNMQVLRVQTGLLLWFKILLYVDETIWV